MDTLTPEQRSWVMSRVRNRATAPELLVRSICRKLGYRYRLNRNDLPGRPDLTFGQLRKAILVHGCYWHRHTCRAGQRTPKSRIEFWSAKFTRNHERDRRTRQRLRQTGWRVLVLWECQLKDPVALARRIKRFLEAGARQR